MVVSKQSVLSSSHAGKMNFSKSTFLTVSIFLLLAGTGKTADFNCHATFFEEESLQTISEKFSIFDKVYLQSLCRQLPNEIYELTAVWHTPSGQIQRQDIHSFSMPVTTDYSAFFWMKLLKKTPFKEASSNSSFSEKYYGLWTVKLYLNDQRIGTKSFTIQ